MSEKIKIGDNVSLNTIILVLQGQEHSDFEISGGTTCTCVAYKPFMTVFHNYTIGLQPAEWIHFTGRLIGIFHMPTDTSETLSTLTLTRLLILFFTELRLLL